MKKTVTYAEKWGVCGVITTVEKNKAAVMATWWVLHRTKRSERASFRRWPFSRRLKKRREPAIPSRWRDQQVHRPCGWRGVGVWEEQPGGHSDWR